MYDFLLAIGIIFFIVSIGIGIVHFRKKAENMVFGSYTKIPTETYNMYHAHRALLVSSPSMIYQVNSMQADIGEEGVVLLKRRTDSQCLMYIIKAEKIINIKYSSYGSKAEISIEHDDENLASPYKLEIFSRHIEDIEDAVSRMSASLKNIKR